MDPSKGTEQGLKQELIIFTARNQNRSIKYRDFGDIRLKE
jgi:hypothetical protein